MRFSGHETFSIREGWLHKGLSMLRDEPDKLFDEHAADYLGVGTNMAKSIRHWLQATGMADRDPNNRGKLIITSFGECIARNDIFFVEPGTWWFLHINLINEPIYADTWGWFFNRFNFERFEKATVVENLLQYVRLADSRVPSIKTLERDVTCLLASYARQVPSDHKDPEEARDCPFRELGLMTYYKTSGYYQIHRRYKNLDPNVFAYALSKAFKDDQAGTGAIDISIYDAVRKTGGPGRAFALDSESLFEVALKSEERCDDRSVSIVGHAGSQMIRVAEKQPAEWAEQYYIAINREVYNAV